MVVFDRSLETGALTKRQRLDLRASPDNLEIDLNRGKRERLLLLLLLRWRVRVAVFAWWLHGVCMMFA